MIDTKNNYKLSDEFIKKLADLSAGYLPPEKFEELITLFENETAETHFSFSSESNLLRIISNMYDRISFMLECMKYPQYAEIIIAIAANSNYLTDILVINPEFFYWIINPSTLSSKIEKERFSEELNKSLASYKSLHAKLNAIRTIKRKEILRIGTKDILGDSSLEETTSQLSVLANIISGELFKLCYNEVLAKYNLKNLKRKYCIISLGKLGGNELNYSSDIDLIIFYDKNSDVTPHKKYNEILTEAVFLFIESASSITSKGFIYRVDFRLRPDGRTSAICRSVEEYLNYYEIRGDDWERQMLIKASFLNGSKSLYDKFINYLQPFIYPSSFSISPTEQIKKLKVNIEKNLKDPDNIKLLPGGIRDIEFSVQALQLLNGGRNKELKCGNTIGAVKKLKAAGLLNENEAATFDTAYRFYRKIEHYLQLMNDSQTHSIPQDGEILDKMSSYLNYRSTGEFKKSVLEYRRKVQAIFNSIMGIESDEDNRTDMLSYINFENRARAVKDLQFLREGIGLLGQKQFDKKSIADFEIIEPFLEEYLSLSTNPDLVLQNFVRVLRSVTFPSIWYKEFRNSKFFDSFLQLCEFSQKSIDLFAEDDNLKEFFLTRKAYEKITKASFKSFTAKRFLFTLSVQYTLKMLPGKDVSTLLSSFFKMMIKSLSENFIFERSLNLNYAIAALGSFGAGEMTFSSDIDLVFIVENMQLYPEIQSDFQNLFLSIKDALKPVEVDCRLRPEGKSSILVWDLKSYQSYAKSRARVWELQAFCKLDFIAGDNKLISRLANSVSKRIKSEADDKLRREISDMRKRLSPSSSSTLTRFFNIKKSSGGIADIDFLIQYLILSSGLYSKLRAKGIVKSILFFVENFKQYSELQILKNNYSFLKNLELTNQNIFNSSSSILPADEKKLESLALRMDLGNGENLLNILTEIIKTNRLYFSKYLG